MDLDKSNNVHAHRLALWRKKRIFIFISILISFTVVFAIQFYMIDQKGKPETEEDEAFMQSIKIKFIDASKGNTDQRKRHTMVLNGNEFRYLTERPTEVFETDQELGIPYVNSQLKKPYVPKHRIVHFDLKGAPPTISYIKKVISLAKNAGATGVLMEYEDMFPFTGNLASIAAKNAYTMDQIKEILQYTEKLKLEVIPLVQTFGHMEFALKHKAFSHVREVPESPQALCPSRNSSLNLVRELVFQILDAHPSSKYLHIGCDEVFEIGECNLCRLESHETLFLRHVEKVANIVHDNYPKIQVIIWDDMLRHISQQTLEASKIGDLVEPMVWVYAEEIYRFVQPPVWDKYAAVFRTAWTASAFKGAYGETLYTPNARRHLENNLRWLDVMATQSSSFKRGFRGIVVTGWQRYDHFAVLCELLPAAIPSLVLNLLATTYGYFNVTQKDKFLDTLSCPREKDKRPFLNLDADPHLWDRLSRCLFPGHDFFKLTGRLRNIEMETKEYLDVTTKQRGWMTAYNAKYNYSLPLRVDELTQELPRIYHGLINVARAVADSLAGIMDNYTISEWIEQRIYPYLTELDEVQNRSMALKRVKYWQARPLPILKDLQKHGIALE